MDYISPLPAPSGAHLGTTYFPGLNERDKEGPTLCRLYFGKVFPNSRPKFVNSSNFPLDEARYLGVRAVANELPDSAAVARGMAQMLARLHFLAHVDARDVEFVLGGDGHFGHKFYIIDFNQVRNLDPTPSVADLVEAFFGNDPYYPRPGTGNLYNEFKSAYLSECPVQAQGIDQAFIHAIEQGQAERNASRG